MEQATIIEDIDFSLHSEETPPVTRQSLMSVVFSILGSLALIFVAINYAPLLEQIELISQIHSDYNGFELSYVFFVQLVLIVSAVICIIRYTINYVFDLEISKPLIPSVLKILNLLVASSIWIAVLILAISSQIKGFLNFENDFNWWFTIIFSIIGNSLYALIGLFVASRILPSVPDFIAICICLFFSVSSISLLLLVSMIPAAIVAIMVSILVIRLLLAFLRIV